MDTWTTLLLPEMNDSKAMDRIGFIGNWVYKNNIDPSTVGASSRIVRFKRKEDATFFKISFKGAV